MNDRCPIPNFFASMETTLAFATHSSAGPCAAPAPTVLHNASITRDVKIARSHRTCSQRQRVSMMHLSPPPAMSRILVHLQPCLTQHQRWLHVLRLTCRHHLQCAASAPVVDSIAPVPALSYLFASSTSVLRDSCCCRGHRASAGHLAFVANTRHVRRTRVSC